MKNLRNEIDVKHVSNKKDYLKWTSKPSYMSHKMFDIDLVAIRKSKVTLTLNKPTYVGMCFMISIMITLKINITATQDYYSKIIFHHLYPNL